MLEGYFAFMFEATKSSFMQITVAYPALVIESKTLLSYITGKQDHAGLPVESWGQEEFVDEEFLRLEEEEIKWERSEIRVPPWWPRLTGTWRSSTAASTFATGSPWTRR